MRASRGRITRGSAFTKDALRLRESHYGESSPEYAAALIRSADWYRYIGQFGREVDQERKALGILEKNFGPRDARLAVPLIRLATARMAQRVQRRDAEQILGRARALDFGSGQADGYLMAEVLATTGDLHVVFGTAADSGPFYERAWQMIASRDPKGFAAANHYFGRVRHSYLATPDGVANLGTVNLGYTVTALGNVEDVAILANNVPALDGPSEEVRAEVGAAMWNAMRRSRCASAIDGKPVATSGLSFATEFCLDPTELVPICRAGADVSVTR